MFGGPELVLIFILLLGLGALYLAGWTRGKLRALEERLLERIRKFEETVVDLDRQIALLRVSGAQRSASPMADPVTEEPAQPPAQAASIEAPPLPVAEEPVSAMPVVPEIADDAPEAVQPELPPRSPPPAPPPGRFEWERLIGLRLPVWLGAIALSIAGFFFVSYAIESGFFTPEMRVLSAAAASLAFLAGAEVVRRRIRTGNVAALAGALAAASIATAYATAYLASITYGLVSTGAGFVVTVAVSAIALAIALAYGQVVALIGIAGAYVAPAVFGSGATPSAAFLAIYVIALTAVSFAVIRWKSWWRLSVVGLVGPALWGLIWFFSPSLLRDTFWGNAFLIAQPVIVMIASWPFWRDDGGITGLRGITGERTAPRRALAASVVLASIGFILFLAAWSHAVGYWQGFLLMGGLAVAVGFVSAPHRALQVPILIAVAVALLLWPVRDSGTAFVVIATAAAIFGFGALDQFRRMREPGFWAAILSFVALFMFAAALFKVRGWEGALADRHLWALASLAIAAAFVVLLRIFGPRVAPEVERSRVYAAWGGTVTTLVSLAVVLEVDPTWFPAASALAILGLGAVHLRAPVRGLRVLAAVYAVIYGLLILGAGSAFSSPFMPAYHRYVFIQAIDQHALVALVLPGIGILGGASLFHLNVMKSRLIQLFDVTGIAALAAGLWFLFLPARGLWQWEDTLLVGGQIVSAELIVALAAIYLGHRFGRIAAFVCGLLLTGLVGLGMLGTMIVPLLSFWPAFAVAGTVVFNVALIAYGLPALLLFAIGWLVRQDSRAGVRTYGIVISIYAVVVTYVMLLVEIRQAFHLVSPTLAGDMSQSEYYAYSIGTLLFGIALLVIGVAFRHRGARAVSFVFVLAATVKVFLFDASELTGLWRVLSFLLMGLSFLGISWAYARFVFQIGSQRRPAPSQVANR